jgi:hypothetical protein
MSFYSKRFQARPAESIGSWKNISEIMSVTSITCNMAIIYFTSTALATSIMPDYAPIYQFMVIVMIEHIILALKMLISILIKDVPSWVVTEMHE